jgi:sugar phosphate isomerase/epimerase
MAADLGGCILVTHDITIPEPGSDGSDARRRAFVDSLGLLARESESHGVRFALENTGRGFTSDPERLAALVDEVGAANVGAVIDTGHRNLCGDPVDALRTLGPRLISLHLHDNHGDGDEHLLPGRGSIDWGGVVQALADVNYGGVFMYEISRPEDVGELAANKAQLLSA